MPKIDLTPSVEGYRKIQRLFRYAVEAHESTIQEAQNQLQNLDTESSYSDLMQAAMEALIEERSKSCQELRDQIAELEVYCSCREGGY